MYTSAHVTLRIEKEMLVEVVTDDPVDTCARKLRIAGALVGEADVQRSTLLQEIALLTGQTEIAISDESFQLWKRFYSDCPSSFRELVSVVRVRRGPNAHSCCHAWVVYKHMMRCDECCICQCVNTAD